MITLDESVLKTDKPLSADSQVHPNALSSSQEDESIKSQQMTLSEFSTLYYEQTAPDLAPLTRKNHIEALRSLKVFAGDIPLDSISFQLVQQYKIHRLGQLAPSTLNHHLMVFRRALRYAVRLKLIHQNPLEQIAFADDGGQPNAPTFLKEQLEALLMHIGELARKAVRINKYRYPEWLDIIEFGRSTGMRLQELVNAKWGQLDTGDWTIAVVSTHTFRTKTRRNRFIPIPEKMQVMLKRRYERWARSSEYIFPNPHTGKRRCHKSLSRVFTKFVHDVGLPKGLSFKSLRSYYATTCADKGVPPHMLKDWMGHTSIFTTMTYYVKPNKRNFAEHIKGVEF